MTKPPPASSLQPGKLQSSDLTYFVEGMDCANCVQNVERMVSRLPGTGEVRTSFSRQTLALHLDESQTSRTVLEKNLRALGYAPSLRSGENGAAGSGTAALPTSQEPHEHNHQGHNHQGHDHHHHDPAGHAHTHEAAPAGQPWYAGGQGRLVLLSGTLLLLAWLFGLVEPRLAQYGYAAATLVGVWPLARRALAGIRLGNPFSIDLLVTLAAVGALLIGQAAEGAVVVFLFAVGELLEGVAAGRARSGIQALAALTPRTALVVGADGQVAEVAVAGLQIGQTVQVNPGARVPADGVIVAGESSLDDSPVTGESVPVVKGIGTRVFAGSINGEGALRVQVDRAASDNTMARILRLVEEAEESKAPTARFIDRFSRWYTPGVVLVAALVAMVPPLLLGQPWHEWLYKGLALLLIGCPCALVLSVPAAVTSAISAGTRSGLLIKGGAVLESLGTIRTVAFDKTGTLTAGQPRVTDVVGRRAEVLRFAAAVESGSSHPLAKALLAQAQAEGLALPPVTGARAIAGKGVQASVQGQLLAVSSPRHAATQVSVSAEAFAEMARLENEGKTVVVLHSTQALLGILAVRDEARPDAQAALARLRALGVQPVMLTGDNARTAQAIATPLGLEKLGIDVQAELLPEDKLRIIDELPGPVAMVGDGINDAPALARADVGIAMGGGTDVALETAGAALLRGEVRGVADLVALSRAATGNIKQNIAFALGLKLVFLVTTLLGYTNLWMAVLADTGATALVTANALRLLRWKPQP